MSCFLSELLFSENSDGLPWSCCRRCRRRERCPCLCDQDLRRAASQGCAAARLLTEKADRLLETVSSADSVRGLLDANETLEYALSRALHQEMLQIHDLCVQTERYAEEQLLR